MTKPVAPDDPPPDDDDGTDPPDLFTTDDATLRPTERTLGKYRLIREFGRGGMGVVYEAEPIDGGAMVALKTLQHGTAAALSRLKAEFRIVADLSHPNLVQLFELNTTGDIPFFTMEIIRGRGFNDDVRASFESVAAAPTVPFNEQRLRSSFSQLVEGLVAFHAEGLIHRDIKPNNVMVTTEGRTVILDLGLAVETEVAKFNNTQHEIAGTPYFMAPEQLRGESLTAACDWYAVGVMLYEALTGERAFQSRKHAELLQEKTEQSAPTPRSLVSEVPGDLNDLCLDLMRAIPADRPSGQEILRRLQIKSSSSIESTVWIGRERELACLQSAWIDVRAGKPRVVLVSGRSGLGKTSLVDHFLAGLRRQERVLVLRGRCYENEAVAYRGFDGVVDSLSAFLCRLPRQQAKEILPTQIDQVCQLFPVLEEAARHAGRSLSRSNRRNDPREKQKGLVALRDMLIRLSWNTAVVIFIDDLQQGDEDTAAIFGELTRRDETPAVLFLATYRSEDADINSCLRLVRQSQLPAAEQLTLTDQLEVAIEKLSHAEAMRLASSLLLRHGVNQSESQSQIADEADGDPLFVRMLVEHLVRLRRDGAPIALQPANWTLATVIQERIKSLEKPERVALEILAAAGRPLDQHTLQQVVGAGNHSLGLIRSLRVKRLIRRLGDLQRIESFHDKIRETVLGHLPARKLSKYCLKLAEQMGAGVGPENIDVEFIADLYRRGGNQQQAGINYELAAVRAESTFAFRRAAEYFQYAIDNLKPSGRRELALRKGLGDALANGSRSADAAAQYVLAAALAEPEARPGLQQLAALRYLTSGHVEEGINTLRKVLDHYRLPWPGSRFTAVVGLLSRNAYLRFRGLRPRKFIAGHVPSQRDAAKLDACWTAAAGLSLVDPLRGSFYLAETLRRSLTTGSVATRPRDLVAYMGQVAIGGSRSRAATRRVLVAGRTLATSRREPYSRAMMSLSRGIAALLRGHWSSSRKSSDQAVEHLQHESCHGYTWELATARTFAFWSLQYQGNLGELARRQPEMLRLAKESDDLFAMLNFGTQVTAHLELANDNPEESLRRLEEDRARLSSGGFFIQHHNQVLAKTYSLLYQAKPCDAMAAIDGQWKNYRREFLSLIQQVRVDHRQVFVRVLIALAASEQGEQRSRLLSDARKEIHRLRKEKVGWASALAIAFDAGCDNVAGDSELATEKLTQASVLLFRADMKLFATAAEHHLATLQNNDPTRVNERWVTHCVRNGPRMAEMLVPGFTGAPT